jgi:hypothetical protein
LAPPDGGGCGILLAVDGQQRIVGADRHAGSTLSASNVNLGSGPTLWALFEKDAALFRDRNPGDIHAGLVAVGKRTNMDCDRHTTRTWRFASPQSGIYKSTLPAAPRFDWVLSPIGTSRLLSRWPGTPSIATHTRIY